MTIEVGQKWICLVDSFICGDGGLNDIIIHFKEGDIIQIIKADLTQPFPYYINDEIPLDKKEILDSFILLAEFRDRCDKSKN